MLLPAINTVVSFYENVYEILRLHQAVRQYHTNVELIGPDRPAHQRSQSQEVASYLHGRCRLGDGASVFAAKMQFMYIHDTDVITHAARMNLTSKRSVERSRVCTELAALPNNNFLPVNRRQLPVVVQR